jgi:hypothetical protein
VCQELGRNSIAIELNADYVRLIEDRLNSAHVSKPPKIKKYSKEWYAAQGSIGGKKVTAEMSNGSRLRKSV